MDPITIGRAFARRYARTMAALAGTQTRKVPKKASRKDWKITASQAIEAVNILLIIADVAAPDGPLSQETEVRLGDSAVRSIVNLRDRIVAHNEAISCSHVAAIKQDGAD